MLRRLREMGSTIFFLMITSVSVPHKLSQQMDLATSIRGESGSVSSVCGIDRKSAAFRNLNAY